MKNILYICFLLMATLVSANNVKIQDRLYRLAADNPAELTLRLSHPAKEKMNAQACLSQQLFFPKGKASAAFNKNLQQQLNEELNVSVWELLEL